VALFIFTPFKTSQLFPREFFKLHSVEDSRTTVGVRRSTKARLDQNRAPGQCYDGFLCQLVAMWEEIRGNNLPVNNRFNINH